MGNSGSTPAPVPATPMPIEDSVAARAERAQLIASRQSGASRIANDLDGERADEPEAMTRSQLGKADAMVRQPQPRGPSVRRNLNKSAYTGGSAVITG